MSRAHGKVILLGEHAVVYGRPALAAGLSDGVVGEAKASEFPELLINPWGTRVRDTDEGELAKAFRAVLELFDKPSAVRVSLDVAIPAGAGLGCSAAMGVATVGALDEWHKTGRTKADLAAAGLVWEKVFHGNPSGVDNTIATHGGVAMFVKGEPIRPVRLSAPLHLVVAHSGESSSTKSMVDSVANQRGKNEERVDKVFDAIEALVRNAVNEVETGNLKHLGQLMDMNQALLSSLLLSTPEIETLCHKAREAGAFGAKLTGAGGGGCVVSLVDSDRSAAVIQALQAHSTQVFAAVVS